MSSHANREYASAVSRLREVDRLRLTAKRLELIAFDFLKS
jgi:hypothetical protein